MNKDLSERLSVLESRLESLEHALSEIGSRLDTVDSDQTALHNVVDQLDGTLHEVRVDVWDLDSRFWGLDSRTDALDSQLDTLGALTGSLETKQASIDDALCSAFESVSGRDSTLGSLFLALHRRLWREESFVEFIESHTNATTDFTTYVAEIESELRQRVLAYKEAEPSLHNPFLDVYRILFPEGFLDLSLQLFDSVETRH